MAVIAAVGAFGVTVRETVFVEVTEPRAPIHDILYVYVPADKLPVDSVYVDPGVLDFAPPQLPVPVHDVPELVFTGVQDKVALLPAAIVADEEPLTCKDTSGVSKMVKLVMPEPVNSTGGPVTLIVILISVIPSSKPPQQLW